ncbi:unnamed protein product, partial [Discosporangium mesarthrocarpum]
GDDRGKSFLPIALQFHRAPTDNDRGGYVGQWEAAGLLGPAVGPLKQQVSWKKRGDENEAVEVTSEFVLRPKAPKARLCQLMYKVGGQVCDTHFLDRRRAVTPTT